MIIGAGGHAQVVADILFRKKEKDPSIEIVGYLDDDGTLSGRKILQITVLGMTEELSTIPHDAVIVAVGENETRKRIFDKLNRQGEEFATARHPLSIIGTDCEIGAGTMICAGTIVNPSSKIGRNVILNTGCTVDHHNVIEDHVHIAPGVHLGGNVTVAEGSFLGIGACVLPGRRIGTWSVVGAGAIVIKDVPDRVTVAGIPARIVRNPTGGR